jgi:Mrp family chromosome partitioning ATPase
MSAIDRAFIRAYEVDDEPPVTRSATVTERTAGRTAAVQAPAVDAPPAPHVRIPAESGVAAAATSQRRPLSAFAPQAPTVEARFRPALEVDQFRWPTIVSALVAGHAARWEKALAALIDAVESGRTLIGVGGTGHGAGATTVAACLARLLVDAGKTVALVDGDFRTAGLARSLGVAPDAGWEDVLAGRAPLADAVIHSLGDRLALLPLVQGGPSAAEKLDGIHASITAGVLRYHFDVVLFDLGAVADRQQGPTASRLARRCRLDGLVIVAADAGAAACEQLLAAEAPELATIGLGVIENQLASA